MKVRVSIDAQTFEVEVGDLNARPIPVTVEGDTFLVMPVEREEALPTVEAAGTPVAVQAPLRGVGAPAPSVKSVQAPIPGVIISVAVKSGEAVHFGQELCVLEAMKMKNIIRASRDGTIGALHVAAGDQVRHGQVLMDYSD
jgi:glutaconyl-CoA/methylmalonyl-CoA decarboxylase subunit gamma